MITDQDQRLFDPSSTPAMSAELAQRFAWNAAASQNTYILDEHLHASPNAELPRFIADALHNAIHHHLKYSLGTTQESCSQRELYRAMVLTVRDHLIDGMLETEKRYRNADAKRLYYLSMEFLIGRSLDTNLSNLGIFDLCREVLKGINVDLEDVLDNEKGAALGNGGLGRLAACFLDSLATLGMPGYGYGINYEYGLFKQVIENGYQKEQPDQWLSLGSSWLMTRPEESCSIPLYGRLESSADRDGNPISRWVDYKVVIGVPHDMPIVGYGGQTVNILRLYAAKSSHEFDMQVFNRGDYLKAVEQKIASEMISKVLYPSDSVEAGRELRLVQEYFLAACAIDDIIRNYLKSHDGFDDFPAKVAIQLNDTHPALVVAELMRRLVDEHDVP
jgi:starch phosphorylase